jgi:hypothetical protein
MMSVLKKSAAVVILIVSSTSFVHAQIDLSKYEVGVSGGVMIYQGDLTPEKIGAYKTMRRQFAFHVYRIMSPSFSLRFNVNRGKLHGDDARYANPDWRRQRNFNFTTPVTEFSLQGVWNILQARSPKFSPYVFAGVGVSFLKVRRDWSNFNAAAFGDGSDVQAGLAIDAVTPTPRVIPVVPVGAGVRYALNDRFSLNAETSYRLSFTDYLDGFSKSANPGKKDHYFTHSIGVIYSFGKKNKTLGCPSVN